MRYTFLSLCFLIPSYSWGQIPFSGYVRNDGSQPLVNIHVEMGEYQTTTDQNGFFKINLDSSGSYLLQLHGLGYAILEKEFHVKGEQEVHFILEEAIYNLEPVELISSWIKPDQPFTYTNIDATKLEQKNLGQDVPFLLRWTPSAVVTSDAGTGIGYTGIRIRGSDPSRINVTIDGIPLNDAESQGVFWVDLPDFASSVDAIQIQRGVGTSTHGAGAFGGTINLKTSGISQAPYVNLSSSLGSFQTTTGKLEIGSGVLSDRFSIDSRISKLKSEGYIDRGTADLESIFLSGKYLRENQSLKLNFFTGKEITYQAWNGVPAQYISDKTLRTYNTAGMKSDGTFHDDEVDNYSQTHVHLIYNKTFSKTASAKIALHYTRGKGYFEQYRNEDPLSSYRLPDIHIGDSIITSSDLIRRRWLDNDFLGGIFSWYLQPAQRWQMNIGGGWNRYWGNHFGQVVWSRFTSEGDQNHEYYRDDALKDDKNLYIQFQHTFGGSWNAYLDLQLRSVDYEFLGFNEQLSPFDTRESMVFFNPKVGLSYQGDHRAWYYSFGVAHREPNRDDFVNSTSYSTPKPEILFDQELGFRRQWQALSINLNGYYMMYKDQLIPTGKINDVGAYVRTNVANSYRLGLECEASFAPSPRISFFAGATASSNKIRSFSEFMDNWDTGVQEEIVHKKTDIAFSPSIIAQGNVLFKVFEGKRNTLEVEWLNKYVGKQYLDNTSNDRTSLDPYFFSDLHFRFNIKPNWAREISMKFLIRNLFDSNLITNGWTYRYASAGYDARTHDPYARLESGSTYNLTGYYPQAGINFLFGIALRY